VPRALAHQQLAILGDHGGDYLFHDGSSFQHVAKDSAGQTNLGRSCIALNNLQRDFSNFFPTTSAQY
jgi:hypothetical protein